MPTSLANKKTEVKPEPLFKSEIGKACEVAQYYGFTTIGTPSITKADVEKARSALEFSGKEKTATLKERCDAFICAEEKIALLRTFNDKNMQAWPQPVMLYHEGYFGGQAKKKNPKEYRFGLEMMATPKSIAEATLIKTTLEILGELGFKDLYVEINSIGDRDSQARFQKELTLYFRKHIEILSADCRQSLKENVYDIVRCDHEKCQTLRDEMPKSIAYLTEISRIHFKEVLEYLETLGISYKINNALLGNKSFGVETVFEIFSGDRDMVEKRKAIACGVRYNSLAKKIGFKRDLAAAGIKVIFSEEGDVSVPKGDKKFKKPKVYFIQLGFDAKLKSLNVIEILRRERIPLYQALAKDKLGGQLSVAESMKIPYTILMGQKEAMENSVIVRDMLTRSQETVSIEKLPDYIRRLK